MSEKCSFAAAAAFETAAVNKQKLLYFQYLWYLNSIIATAINEFFYLLRFTLGFSVRNMNIFYLKEKTGLKTFSEIIQTQQLQAAVMLLR